MTFFTRLFFSIDIFLSSAICSMLFVFGYSFMTLLSCLCFIFMQCLPDRIWLSARRKRRRKRGRSSYWSKHRKLGGSDPLPVYYPEIASSGPVLSPAPFIEAAGNAVQGSTWAEVDLRKRPPSQHDIVQTYAPKWGVLALDAVAAVACPAPDGDRHEHLQMLPWDALAYAVADLLSACTELIALLTMVSPSTLFVHIFFFCYACHFSFLTVFLPLFLFFVNFLRLFPRLRPLLIRSRAYGTV